MGNYYEDMFSLNGGSKKKTSKAPKEFDWMAEATKGGSSSNLGMGGFDVSSVIKSSGGSKKHKEPNIMQTVSNVSKSVGQVKKTIHTIRSAKDESLIRKASEIKQKEEHAKKVEAARKVVEDYQERKAEYEARKKEQDREQGKQTVFEKLRNLRKSANKTPTHLQNKNNNNP